MMAKTVFYEKPLARTPGKEYNKLGVMYINVDN